MNTIILWFSSLVFWVFISMGLSVSQMHLAGSHLYASGTSAASLRFLRGVGTLLAVIPSPEQAAAAA